jgi:glycosyltransferase involved in cell wall biosynthesis
MKKTPHKRSLVWGAGTREGRLPVVLYDPSVRGGVCHYTYNMAEGLAGLGCRVTLLTSHGYELTDMPRRFKLVVAFKPGWIRAARSALRGRNKPHRSRPLHSDPDAAGEGGVKAPRGTSRLHRLRVNLFLLRAVGRILAARSRIVHIQWSVDRDQDLRLVRLLKGLGIRTVYTAHNLVPHGVERPGEREAFTELYRTVDQVVVFAENNRRELIESFGIAADRVCVIPHGSDSSLFPKYSQESARAELGIGAERRVVLFFGHIKRYKGLEYLVQAFDRLPARVDGALLLVAGKVDKSDPEDLQRYSTLVEALLSRRDVVCISEYIPVSRVGLYFAAADVVALPYVRTYHSGILMTAYAAGKPVVATDTGMLAEDVREGRTGFVVPPRDVDALADRIAEILTRPDRGRGMGEEARQLSETCYSWSAVAEKTVALYRRLLESESEIPGGAPGDRDGSPLPEGPDHLAMTGGVRGGRHP